MCSAPHITSKIPLLIKPTLKLIYFSLSFCVPSSSLLLFYVFHFLCLFSGCLCGRDVWLEVCHCPNWIKSSVHLRVTAPGLTSANALRIHQVFFGQHPGSKVELAIHSLRLGLSPWWMRSLNVLLPLPPSLPTSFSMSLLFSLSLSSSLSLSVGLMRTPDSLQLACWVRIERIIWFRDLTEFSFFFNRKDLVEWFRTQALVKTCNSTLLNWNMNLTALPEDFSLSIVFTGSASKSSYRFLLIAMAMKRKSSIIVLLVAVKT